MDINALYELKRQSFLIGFIQNPDHFDAALAYAHEHRVAPIYHEDILREHYKGEDPFGEAYAVNAEFVEAVTNFMDECWGDDLRRDELSFPRLEDRFGGYKANRMELRRAIEYARISQRFDDPLFEAIDVNAPAEAKGIAKSFSPEDVHFG